MHFFCRKRTEALDNQEDRLQCLIFHPEQDPSLVNDGRMTYRLVNVKPRRHSSHNG